MLLIGYDLGSSSVKAALMDGATKKVLAKAQFPAREMPIYAEKEGWAEQDPNDWWTNIKEVTDLLFQETTAQRTEVKAIGIAYQMHGLVAVDKKGELIRPSIIWCDSRAAEIGAKAFEEIGEEKCLQHLLNSPANFTASKLKWVQENEPELYECINKIMLPGDFIAFKFTNKINTTVTGLSEGIFWDFQEEELSQMVLDYFGISPELIPETVPVFSVQAKLSTTAIEAFGFHKDAVIAYRAGDQPNNALSMNVLAPGEIAATAGTSGVVYGVVDSLKFDPKNRVNSFAHINHTTEKKRLGILLCINGTGSAYSWLRNQLAPEQDYESLEKMAEQITAGAEGLSFLPFGNGAERMLGNQIVGAQFHGIDFHRHQFAHMVRACLEGIAFSFVYGIRCMKDTGLDPKAIKVGNDNLFQSNIFSEIIATLTSAEIQVKESSGAIGAAIGAGVGVGKFQNLHEAFSEEQIYKVHTSNNVLKEPYQVAYEKWLSYLPIN